MTAGEDGKTTDLKTVSRCLNPPFLRPQNDKTYAKLRLLYQNVYQSPCLAYSYS